MALSGLKIKRFLNSCLLVQWVAQDLVLVPSEAINGVNFVGRNTQVVFFCSLTVLSKKSITVDCLLP